MSQERKKKAIEYHFVDMNDPDRYKKLKVARACDFCRKRKSKCDVGVPGSSTCSNCKKSNRICQFSPVTQQQTTHHETDSKQKSSKNQTPPVLTNTLTQTFQFYSQHSPLHSPHTDTTPQRLSFTTNYINQNPFFSIDHQGYCGYEKHGSILNTHLLLGSVLHELPTYTKQFEQELFDVYFCYVHPCYPILDRYSISQTLRYDNNAIPLSLKWAVMAIALRFTKQYPDANLISIAYHQHACIELDGKEPSLFTLQTLFLLYKYQELLTPVGMPMTAAALTYLRHIQAMIPEVQQQLNENSSTWPLQDEMLCRASWILLIIVSMSSPADSRFSELMDYCTTPTRKPVLTETEHYDKTELQTACNLIQLINLTLLFSRGICLLSNHASLFVYGDDPKFNLLASDLEEWKAALPPSISAEFVNQQQHPFYDASSHPASTFMAYICLIHDILQLILAIQQPSAHHAEYVVSKAFQLSYRAYQFCVHDMHLSKLAFIQGSRLIAYGLTIAYQSLYYCYAEQQEQHRQTFLECRSLIFQTFESLHLIPQLFMALQTLNNQLDAKEKLLSAEKHHYQPPPLSNASTSDSFSTPPTGSSGTLTTDTSQSRSGDYFFGSNPPSFYESSSSTSTPGYHQRTTHLEQRSWPENAYPSEENSFHDNLIHHYETNAPMTPTFEDDTGMSSIDLHYGPLTPPVPHLMVDSYFHTVVEHTRRDGSSIAMANDLLPMEIKNFKSCERKRLA
ncbi:hypothetical protein A0J61_02442 [Choanephora cucurbitarum]|uniref:Zn(2)-C6 fungal-type domain-containing protein n=1 Tax=Choanephora cucurbitarum TaxID=101091 RepID=A0A1C7NM51_9FUNG|nr:hypothetical protein A0J61_02442 [Choanephora cucurbitarum]